MRDLPPEIPDQIAIKLHNTFGDMQVLATSAGLDYDTARSVLVTGGSRAADVIMRLSAAADVGPTMLAKAFAIKSKGAREAGVNKLVKNLDIDTWAKESKVARSTIYKLYARDENLQISNLVKVISALDIGLSEWCECYGIYFRELASLAKST